MKIESLKEYVLVLISVCLTFFLLKYLHILSFMKELFSLLSPVFIGFCYAWIINPLIRKFSKKYSRNLVCIVLFFIVLLCVFSFFSFLIPVVMKEFSEFMEILPSFLSFLRKEMEHIGCLKYVEQTGDMLFQNIPSVVLIGIKSTFGMLGNIVIGFVLGLYISFEYEKMIRFLFSFFKRKKIETLILDLSDGVRKCIYGTCLVAFFVFILDSVFFFVIGLDAPLLLGFVCGITDLIPYIGPYIGGALAVLVGFTEKKSLGILAILVCFIVQGVENYILQPMVMSKSIKISPVYIMISLLVFGKLFGVLGMILATPILTMIKILGSYYFSKFDKVIKT